MKELTAQEFFIKIGFEKLPQSTTENLIYETYVKGDLEVTIEKDPEFEDALIFKQNES